MKNMEVCSRPFGWSRYGRSHTYRHLERHEACLHPLSHTQSSASVVQGQQPVRFRCPRARSTESRKQAQAHHKDRERQLRDLPPEIGGRTRQSCQGHDHLRQRGRQGEITFVSSCVPTWHRVSPVPRLLTPIDRNSVVLPRMDWDPASAVFLSPWLPVLHSSLAKHCHEPPYTIICPSGSNPRHRI